MPRSSCLLACGEGVDGPGLADWMGGRMSVAQIPAQPETAAALGRRWGRRRWATLLLALPAEALAGGEAVRHTLTWLHPFLTRLTNDPVPVVLLLLHDGVPEPLAACCRDPAELFGNLLRQAARCSLTAIADGISPPAASRLTADCEAVAEGATMAARMAGFGIAGAALVPPRYGGSPPAPLAPLLASTPRPGRRRTAVFVTMAAATVAAMTLVAWSSWSWMRDLERRVLAGTAVVEGFAAREAPPSPLALGALGDLAGLAEGDGARSPLLPSSWSRDLEEAARAYVNRRLEPVLVQPVRRQLEADLHDIADTLAAATLDTGSPPLDEAARLAVLLERLAELDERYRLYHLEADGDVPRQWEALTRDKGSLAWLDSATGREAISRAVTAGRLDDTFLRRLADMGVSLLGRRLAEAEGTGSDDLAALALARSHAERALSSAGLEDRPGDAITRLANALEDVTRLGTAATGAPVDRFARLTAGPQARLAATGLVTPARWREAQQEVEAAAARRAAALVALSLPHIGPLFHRAADGTVTLAPRVARTAAALRALMGIVGEVTPPPLDLKALAQQDGSPDPAALARATERLTQRQNWLSRHAPDLPEALRARLRPLVDASVAAAALADFGAAYRSGGAPMASETASQLQTLLAGLAALDSRLAQDAAWLAGVRAYRTLERLDKRLDAPVSAAEAAPVVAILDLDAVRGALGESRLLNKWRTLVVTDNSGT